MTLLFTQYKQRLLTIVNNVGNRVPWLLRGKFLRNIYSKFSPPMSAMLTSPTGGKNTLSHQFELQSILMNEANISVRNDLQGNYFL
jgi:hypothetical protein